MLAFPKFSALCILLSATLAATQNATAASQNAAAARKPNVVFILTDDQDLHMNSLDYMPRVQSLLINEGTSFMRHYSPTALCCPARVSIWTGLHSHNHGVSGVQNGPFGGWQKILAQGLNDDYLPIWLRENGYRTYYTGKLYNGMDDELVEKKTAKGWTKADLLVGSKAYTYYDPSFQHIENNNWDNPGKVISQPGNYSTDRLGEYAVGYIEDSLQNDQPFFVGIAPIAPHTQLNPKVPPVPAEKYKDTKPGINVPPSDNFNPVNRSGVNAVWSIDRLEQDKLDVLQENYQARIESLLSVDELVKNVVELLEKNNQLDNTYIIYSSDNGFHLGHHRMGPGKKMAFEEDINVPLIIRGPDVPKNKATDLVTAHVDLAPTILHMTDTQQRKNADGHAIPYTEASISERENNDGDEYTGVEFWAAASFSFSGLKGSRVNTFKSLRLIGKDYDIMYAVHCQNNAHELYNMKNDPGQMRNLHPTAPHEEGQKNAFDSGDTSLGSYPIRKLLQRLDALVLVLKSCKGNTCTRPWQELHPSATGVKNLNDAMNTQWDGKYQNLYDNMRVRFTKCYRDGTIDPDAEGPQWQGGDRVSSGKMSSLNQTTFTLEEDENATLGWEEQGYWDDWE